MEKRRALLIFLTTILLSGCISQPKQETETPTPTTTPNAIEAYAKEIGLDDKVIEVLKPADTNGILDESERRILDLLTQIPEEERLNWAQWLMIDKQIKEYEVGEIEKVVRRFEEEKIKKEKEEKERQERLKNAEKVKQELELLKDETFTLEDGIQIDLEKNFLVHQNDQKLAQDLKKYYLGEIEKIYPELATELNKLPELSPLNVDEKSLEALEDIYGLLLTTEPYKNYNDRFKPNIPRENETWEAFGLMIKGGVPDRKDFGYEIPKFNTELEILFWLAEQNEFKQDDTLALAIAMVNGLWVTMGDDEVRETVKKDTNDLLNFFRETNEWQRQRGFYLLEDYPIEAKVCLSWTGGLNMHWVGPRTQPRIPMRLVYYSVRKLPLLVYQKDTISLEAMKKMRAIAYNKDWWGRDTNLSIKKIEDYFYSFPLLHWEFMTQEPILDENGLDSWWDVDWQFNRYLKGLNPKGDCGTETSFIDAWGKSMGIATIPHWMYRLGQPIESSSWYSHSYTIYFDPNRRVWTAYEKQIKLLVPKGEHEKYLIRYFIFRPPVDQRDYLEYNVSWNNNIPDYYYEKLAFYFKEIPFGEAKRRILMGISTSQMKQWLLYSNG